MDYLFRAIGIAGPASNARERATPSSRARIRLAAAVPRDGIPITAALAGWTVLQEMFIFVAKDRPSRFTRGVTRIT